MRRRINFLLASLLLIFIQSCKENKPEKENNSNLIEVSVNQFQTEQMELGEPSKQLINTYVDVKAKITSQAGGYVKLSLPFDGIVKAIKCQPGDQVKKGQALFEVGGSDFIDIQMALAETSAQLQKAKANHDRLKKLYKENVGSAKDLLDAETEFKVAKAKNAAILLYFNDLNLDVTKISNGDFYKSYQVASPVNGKISNLSLVIGQHFSKESSLLEIIDNSNLILKMSVFPDDAMNFKEGMKVNFWDGNRSNQISAVITSIGNVVDEISKTVECYATIDDNIAKTLINNMFVEARVIIQSDSMEVLPKDAIIKSGDEIYILYLSKQDSSRYLFEKVEVNTGIENEKYISIKELDKSRKILIKGAYNIGG